jgi:DNA polymerase elongation subunit (family B)
MTDTPIESMTDDQLAEFYASLKREASVLHNTQMSIKILMNSLYGATANKFFIYYISAMAESITTSGQLSVKTSEKFVNRYLNKVLGTKDVDYAIYIDTDSNYFSLAELVKGVFGKTDIPREEGEKFLDRVCREKIEKVIAVGYEELAMNLNAYSNTMVMKREKINNKGLFIAKKRNILSTLNSEGVHYSTPKISVTGVEAIRSTTPEVCRKRMMDIFDVVMNKSERELQEFVSDFRSEFDTLPAQDIAKISGTNDIGMYTETDGSYKKGCPMHIRGCILFNQLIKKHGLEDKYDPIRSGDKIKFVYLKTPNPIRENIISFTDDIPAEFGLSKYIDYDTQFEKVFISPIEIVLNSIGWNWEEKASLEAFFA